MSARVAVVGACGWAGTRHIAAFLEVGGRISAVVDPAEAAAGLAASLGASRHADVAELRPDEHDLVVVALPAGLQPDVVEGLLRRGHRVLAEKPLAPGLAATEALAGTPGIDDRLMVGFTLRGHPAVPMLRRWVEVAAPVALSVRSVARKQAVESWRADPAEGGVLVVNGVHALDLAGYLLEGPLRDPVGASSSRLYDSGVSDYAAVAAGIGRTRFRLETYWSPWDNPEGLNAGDWDLTVDLVAPHGRRLWRNDRMHCWDRDGAYRVLELGRTDLFRVQAQGALAFVGGAAAPAGFRDALASARLVDAFTQHRPVLGDAA